MKFPADGKKMKSKLKHKWPMKDGKKGVKVTHWSADMKKKTKKKSVVKPVKMCKKKK